MLKHIALFGLVALVATGCLSSGGIDPNLGGRVLSDLQCAAAVAGQVGAAQQAGPVTTAKVLSLIESAPSSTSAMTVFASCAAALANAGQDVGAVQHIIAAKRAVEAAKKAAPPAAPSGAAVTPAVPAPATPPPPVAPAEIQRSIQP